MRNALDRAGRHGFQQTPAWTLSGSYVEVCNCEPMCSCRPVSDRRKRHPPGGVCAGALSWAIERGHADAVELDGLAAVLAFRHHQAERRGLWQFVVYLDERANDRQRAALVRLFAGAHGRRALVPLPWTPDSGRLVGLRTVCIQADHGPTNPRFDAGSHVCARVAAPVCTQISDSSLIVDHRRAGIERRSDRVRVADDALAFEFRNCRAFQGPFDYAKPDAP